MVFAAHQVKARLLPVDPKTRKQIAVLAPSFALVPVQRHRTTKISAVAALLPELRSAVTQERRKPTAVRFSDDLCSYIEITRDDAKPLDFRLEEPQTFQRLQELRPFQALVGRSYSYGGVDESVDLTDSNQGSTFAAGMSGTGKSTYMRAFLSTLAYSTSPEQLHVHLVDMKHRSFVPFEQLAHVKSAAYEGHEASQVIHAVYDEMMDRKRQARPYRTLLAIDELRELKFVDSELLEMLSRIASLGRELGVSLLCATQKPLASELGSIIKSQFAVRVTGTLEDAGASHTVTGRSGLNAHLLEGKGSMLLVATGREATRMQVYNFDTELVTRLVELSNRRWVNSIRPEKMVFEEASEAVPVKISSKVDHAEVDARKLKDVLPQYVGEDGRLKWGAKSGLAKELLGADARYAGGVAGRVDAAIARLHEKGMVLQ